MSFLAMLLLLLASGTTGTTVLNHFRLEALGVDDAGAVKMTADEKATGQEKNAQKQSKNSQKHAKQEGQTQTLTGTVEWEYKPLSWDCDVPNCDHFALYDDATHANYELDDARAALP